MIAEWASDRETHSTHLLPRLHRRASCAGFPASPSGQAAIRSLAASTSRSVTSGSQTPFLSARQGTVWVSDRMQTGVYRRRQLPGLQERHAVQLGNIRSTSAPLSSIHTMTADHHGQRASAFAILLKSNGDCSWNGRETVADPGADGPTPAPRKGANGPSLGRPSAGRPPAWPTATTAQLPLIAGTRAR